MAVVQNYLPGDPLLIDKIVYELKSQGIFDQFRKECIADVDTKPAYQNLRQRVEGSVSGFLSKQRWSPDMNKNQLREMLRKNIYESGFLETGVERIVDQVVNPKMNSVFLPKVTEVVYKFLGIEKPSDDMHDNQELAFGDDNLLPTDLEAVSPESEKRFDISNDSLTLNDSKIDEDESPPFEPLEEKPVYNIPPEENSVDSHLSGFSGLMSHDSNHSQELSKPIQMEISNQDSTFSKQSSEGRLSIVMSDDNDTKMEICDDSLQAKPKQKPFDLDVTNNTSARKSEGKTEEKSKNDKNEKSDKSKNHHDKHRSRNDSKSDRDKDRKSEKERKDHKDNKYSSKDKGKERDRKDSKSTSSKSSDKDRNKTSKHRSSSSSKDKDKDKEKNSSSRKESTSSSKDRSDKSKSSSSSKDKDLKHKGDSKGTSSKHDSRSDKHKKDDKHKSDRNTSSSNSKNRDKDKKDAKKDKKENKDDHFSSKKRSDRRSTDRDSNDGHSGLKSSSSSFDSYVSSQNQSKGQESSNSNSNNGSGDSGNSDAVEENVLTEAMISTQTEQIVTTMPALKLIKPKFASNIHEAKRLMKIRKQLSLLEKQGNLDLRKMITKQIIEKNEKNRITINNQIKRKDINPISPVRPNREPTPPQPPSPPLKSSVVSAATWDALEAKLHESINYTTGYDDVEGADDVVELVTYTKDDCRYLNSNSSDKTERFKKFSTQYISNLENRIEKQIPIESTPVKAHPVRNNHTNNRSVKRKFTDYNTDVKNNNSNKRFNTHHIEVHENFSLPLSPAESDNSIDKKSDMSDSSDKAMKKTESELVVKKTIRGSSNNQRYSSDDLYKPRPVFGGSRRRNGRNLGVD